MFKSIINKLFNWYFRPKSLDLRLWQMSLIFISIFTVSGTVGVINIFWSSPDGETVNINYSLSDTIPILISYASFIFGALFAILAVFRAMQHEKKNPNIFIEHIGLRSSRNQSLSEAAKKKTGLGSTLFIDTSNYYENSILKDNAKALDYTIEVFNNSIENITHHCDTRNISLHYGGTPSVPIGFSLGYKIGNTSKVSLWDFNRESSEWYALEDIFYDSNTPVIDFNKYNNEKEVCILMGFSFPVSEEQVGTRLNGKGIINITMPKTKDDSMNSLLKLEEFQQKFRGLLKTLASDGVSRIHIFCAAQASLNFSLGRQIERTHPECVVYEYVNDSSLDTQYPWGVLLNSKGTPPSIIT
ncbi:SAVED domain-containing protein [Psychromonas hadalis]|uniref:SAVED domain-containing protein n=1 Tax=Psychromonas hadalis TaxID=211669 RepID=UPI0003B65270|nr:SAVED domain-containing protein [Psychromonas hadalis]